MHVWGSRLGFILLGAIGIGAVIVGINSPAPRPGLRAAGSVTVSFSAQALPVRPVSCEHPPSAESLTLGSVLKLTCPAGVPVGVTLGSRVRELVSGQAVSLVRMPSGGIYIGAVRPGTVVVEVGGRPMTITVRR